MNIEALKRIAKSSKTARVLFQAMATRERSCRAPKYELELARFKLSIERELKRELERREFYKVFSDLQRLGVGAIIHSPKERVPAYFKWKYNLKDIGLAGLGKSAVIIPLAMATKTVVVVRNGKEIAFDLPADYVEAMRA